MVPLLRFVAVALLAAGAVAAVLTWPDRSLTGMTSAEIATCRSDITFNRAVGRPPPECAAFLPPSGAATVAPIQYVAPSGAVLSSAVSALILFALAQVLQLLSVRSGDAAVMVEDDQRASFPLGRPRPTGENDPHQR